MKTNIYKLMFCRREISVSILGEYTIKTVSSQGEIIISSDENVWTSLTGICLVTTSNGYVIVMVMFIFAICRYNWYFCL